MRTGEAFPSKYLAAADLQGATRKLMIASYTIEEIGEEKNEKPVLWFNGAKKGLVLNVTNANTIAEVLGDDEMDNWTGREISIYPTTVAFRGKPTAAIRVKMDAPPPPADDDEVPF